MNMLLKEENFTVVILEMKIFLDTVFQQNEIEDVIHFAAYSLVGGKHEGSNSLL